MSSDCPTCGRALDDHDRHVRFRLPEPVLDRPELMESPDLWTTEPGPSAAVMMVVPELGAFLRALFPIQITGGHTLTYGVWVGVETEALHRAVELWWSPDYSSLAIDGLLANKIEPWGLLGSPVSLAVLDPDATPFCTGSVDPDCQHVLEHEWDHEVPLQGQ